MSLQASSQYDYLRRKGSVRAFAPYDSIRQKPVGRDSRSRGSDDTASSTMTRSTDRGSATSGATNITVPPAHSKKFVVVGDGGCGKTCFLISYSQGYFPEVRSKPCLLAEANGSEIRSNRVRELHHSSPASKVKQTGGVGALGYRWSRRIRPSSTTLISRNRSALRLLRN